MKHLIKRRKFHREKDQRQALFKALITALIMNKKIKTTEAKAKEIRPKVERFITRAKEKSVANTRLIRKTLSEGTTKELYTTAATYLDRKGGYTRITKLGQRKSDSSKMAQIEFV